MKPRKPKRWRSLRYLETVDNRERWMNGKYCVAVLRTGVTRTDMKLPKGCVLINIFPRCRTPRHDWLEFQTIKNEIVGNEWEAVELFPAESRLIDTGNAYNLFCFPKVKFGIFRGRNVTL